MLGRHSTWNLRATPANAVAIRGPTVRNKSTTTSANVVERQKALSASPPALRPPPYRSSSEGPPSQTKHLLELHDSGNYTQAELAELFGVGRSTVSPTR